MTPAEELVALRQQVATLTAQVHSLGQQLAVIYAARTRTAGAAQQAAVEAVALAAQALMTAFVASPDFADLLRAAHAEPRTAADAVDAVLARARRAAHEG